ncbi:hypothetical protein C8F01DRAFT_1080521 [Mycena amicta]|nr:hypothetical protein C8F01DRAFT_1080521 [Mycena amicta]
MPQASFSTGNAPLRRGKACLNCRNAIVTGQSADLALAPRLAATASTTMKVPPTVKYSKQRINDLQNPANRRTVTAERTSSGSGPSQMALGPLLSYFRTLSSPRFCAIVDYSRFPTNGRNGYQCSCFNGSYTQAFHEAIQRQTAQIQSNLPSVLLNVMHLWGIHLSSDARLKRYEPAFLAHALKSTAASLTSTHPRTLLHGAQAEVLLATYFFRNGRIIEGRYHLSAAVGIVLSGRWNILRVSATTNANEMPGINEQIAAFWAVLTLDNVWAGVNGAAGNVVVGPGVFKLNITTGIVSLMDVKQQGGTLARFMADLPDHADSTAALSAKAGVLLASASAMASNNRHGTAGGSPIDTTLERRIVGFTAALPAIQSKTTLIVHLLARVATIRLHVSSGSHDSRGKALGAARDITRMLMDPAVAEEVKGGVVDPIIAPILGRVCGVFIAELTASRSNGSHHLVESLRFLIQIMQIMAPQFQLMATQLEGVQQACNAARIVLA